MKRALPLLALLPALVVVSSGCAMLDQLKLRTERPIVTKRFYNGSIVYTVDSDAQLVVSRLVNLQGQTASLQESADADHRSDRVTLPLYREADLNRDHHITRHEAESFYSEYVRQFEDHVGDVVYR